MPPIKRTTDLIIHEFGSELIIYDLIDNRAVCLNTSAKRIWQMCDGTKSISDTAEDLGAEIGVEVDESFVKFGLSQLGEVNLLQHFKQIPTDSNGLHEAQVNGALSDIFRQAFNEDQAARHEAKFAPLIARLEKGEKVE